MTNTERTIDLLTTNYISMCKAITLDSIEKEYEDMIETALESNDEEFITDKEILNVYIKVLNKFLEYI
ncbi:MULTISPECIES: hypothetical protein [Clostridium]|uniref:Uncharacterized protein n=1 Tax=Clostridium frigoriphilum TaxID=443253 RepID=A0ABU7UVR8_9CLOT|nr:hypothetical protein [Clostridium sp. DSM 17811]MBU3098732.1 hypothetical protein [Clostridium sp. DSM 17811]